MATSRGACFAAEAQVTRAGQLVGTREKWVTGERRRNGPTLPPGPKEKLPARALATCPLATPRQAVSKLPGARLRRKAMMPTSPGRRCFQVRLDQFIVLPGACVRRNGTSEWPWT
ncbi:hypothetical protein MTO96_044335 [Rhipicephalus appendiculatus]